MSETIMVKGPGTDHKTILWETNSLHPDGEIFVVNDGKSYEVGKTPGILRRLNDGRLLPGDAKAAKKDDKKADKKPAGPAAPWEGYDDSAVELILDRLKGSDKAARDQVLAYERANKKRDAVIVPLVNWNS